MFKIQIKIWFFNVIIIPGKYAKTRRQSVHTVYQFVTNVKQKSLTFQAPALLQKETREMDEERKKGK